MEVIKTDVLIIGGGIAGCFAAIRASELGRSVVLLDKATIRRGGSVGPGMDHMSYGITPGGETLEEARELARSSVKELMDPNVLLAVEKDPILLKQLRYEKRLIFLELFWNDEIDFEMFSNLIEGKVIWLE
ncbi:hypothetical protein ES703_103200 [subsurface metagenome]